MNKFELPQLNNNEEEITPETLEEIKKAENFSFEVNLDEKQRSELQSAIQFALNS